MHDIIPTMNSVSIAKVEQLEAAIKELPQIEIKTDNLFHAGMYARTVKIPAGAIITGTIIKIPTILIISGHCVFHIDGAPKEFDGYNVFAAKAVRKSALVALSDVHMTMLFPTDAKTVYDAEQEFTDEGDNLISRKGELCQG